MIHTLNPTPELHPWPTTLNPTALPLPVDALTVSDDPDDDSDDDFMMYDFKVRRCARGRAHDWTDCPFAHPGEKARRRDPRRSLYSGEPCPDFKRAGLCPRGDACELSHGVFECWLHPSRYRTQLCKDGVACRRRVCFFAHRPRQLRVPGGRNPVPAKVESYDGSPARKKAGLLASLASELAKREAYMSLVSPRSTLASWPESPPESPEGVEELSCLFGGMRVGTATRFGSPAGIAGERVESGRALRAKLFEKLSRENGVLFPASAPVPDVAWISELVK